MRALQFKIRLEKLTCKNWEEFNELDQGYIEKVASTNKVIMNYEPRYLEMEFLGKHENLYLFLFQVAGKYDVELI